MRNENPHVECTTRAAVLHGPGQAEIEERWLRPLVPGEVRLAQLICGICGTDTAKYRGEVLSDVPLSDEPQSDEPLFDEPVWPGHEFGGAIEAVAEDVTDLEPGDETAAWIPPGWEFGGLAERTIVQARHCVKMPREQAWALEPLMCVLNAVIKTRPPLGPCSSGGHDPLEVHGLRSSRPRHIVVVGTGMMAQMAVTLSATEWPLSLTVIGRSQPALDRARRLGATRTINTTGLSTAEVTAAVHEQTERVDVVYEAIGEPIGLELALPLARMGADVAILGFHQSGAGRRTLDMGNVIGWRAISLLSGHTRDADTAGLAPEEDRVMPTMRFGAALIEAGIIDLGALREPRIFALDEVREALDTAAKPGSGKVVVDSTR